MSESLVFYIHVHVWVEGALGENEIDPHTFTGDWTKIKKKKKFKWQWHYVYDIINLVLNMSFAYFFFLSIRIY